ncbi:MAG: DUF2333 family protein [Deltaproteobacteria bacterium]|nr:DUF2333 family protein [Deltaproteobacteria bacterium]
METVTEERKKKKGKKTAVLILFLCLIIFCVIVMALNSRKPERLAVGHPDGDIKGMAFIITNQLLIEQMYTNWLPNDLFWPTVFLDNMPNFQIGELEVVRYNIRVLRDNLSRMRTTDKLDPLAEEAFTSLSNDPYKWWFPSAESKWKKASNALKLLTKNLAAGKSHFYARADNLVELLQQYASLMGGVNTRLINAPRDVNRVLAVEDAPGEERESQKLMEVDIPWRQIDDNFYYAQGVAYALYESLKAIRIDFMDVLTDKNSVALLDKIIENLKRCDFEPLIIFNGDPASIFANHSLNLSGVFNDARQKVNSLIVALTQG